VRTANRLIAVRVWTAEHGAGAQQSCGERRTGNGLAGPSGFTEVLGKLLGAGNEEGAAGTGAEEWRVEAATPQGKGGGRGMRWLLTRLGLSGNKDRAEASSKRLPGLTEAEQRDFDNRVQQARVHLDKTHAENVSALAAEHARSGLAYTSFRETDFVALGHSHVVACAQANIDALDAVLSDHGRSWTRQLGDWLRSDIAEDMRRREAGVFEELRQRNARRGRTQGGPKRPHGPNIRLTNDIHKFCLDIEAKVAHAERLAALRRRQYRRLALVLGAWAAITLLALHFALNYGEGKNWFQRIVNSWAVIVPSAFAAVIVQFVIGKERS
jgi:hypothetical protein